MILGKSPLVAAERKPSMLQKKSLGSRLLRDLLAFAILVLMIPVSSTARAAGRSALINYQQTLSIPPDSSRWELQGKANVAEYQGRKCLYLDGAEATVKDFEMRDATIDVDVATPA